MLPGCVSVELKPQKLISDAVSASKDDYKTISHKVDNKEERLYRHSTIVSGDGDLISESSNCIKHVRAVLTHDVIGDYKILSEATHNERTGESVVVSCGSFCRQ